MIFFWTVKGVSKYISPSCAARVRDRIQRLESPRHVGHDGRERPEDQINASPAYIPCYGYRVKPRVHLFHFEVPLFRSYQLNHQSRFYTGLIIFKVFAEEKARAIS